jgi:hypothetical protein
MRWPWAGDLATEDQAMTFDDVTNCLWKQALPSDLKRLGNAEKGDGRVKRFVCARHKGRAGWTWGNPETRTIDQHEKQKEGANNA